MTWMASITGQPVELLAPRVEQVDFRAMANALAHLNRYGGHAETPVSVAMHLVIGCDAAPEAIRPWWLLHDAHEERTGDVTQPHKQTLRALAAELYGVRAADLLEDVRREFEWRHDVVIHQAAGLPLPTDEQRREIKRVDLVALATERRDFHSAQVRSWLIDRERIEPFKRRYRWRPPGDVADELYRRFQAYLPTLARRVA